MAIDQNKSSYYSYVIVIQLVEMRIHIGVEHCSRVHKQEHQRVGMWSTVAEHPNDDTSFRSRVVYNYPHIIEAKK